MIVRMTVRTAANLSLPKDLVDEVDAIAGPRNRSAFVEAAIRDRLRRERLRSVLMTTAGAWSAAAHPEFATSDDVVEWVRARRSEETRSAPGTD
jgi:metal-responsive CopG/Arc/MetJ family transcriptional regulator